MEQSSTQKKPRAPRKPRVPAKKATPVAEVATADPSQGVDQSKPQVSEEPKVEQNQFGEVQLLATESQNEVPPTETPAVVPAQEQQAEVEQAAPSTPQFVSPEENKEQSQQTPAVGLSLAERSHAIKKLSERREIYQQRILDAQRRLMLLQKFIPSRYQRRFK